MTDYNPPPVNAINGKKRAQQIDDRVDYEVNGPKEEDSEPDYSKSRTVRTSTPDKSTRADPVAYLRGKATDAMVAVHNMVSDKKID